MMRFFSTSIRREFIFLVLLPFCLWMACYWGFISGRLLPDQGDGSYFQQTLFFINNILHGVYPLWDPTFYDGSPHSFFLRRIGDGNPFYLLIAAAKLLGFADMQAYRFFVTAYYFLGTVALWLMARLFLRSRFAYTAAFLILLFSGWGSRAFSDYIILLFVPLVWFFYFLISFAREGKRHQFLGIFLAAAIAMTTYIPFFFVTAVGVFLIFFMLLFWNEASAFLGRAWAFIREHRAFVIGCMVFFAMAMAPAVSFFNESKRGEFIMPGRNIGTSEKSTLAVSMDHVKVGDLMAQGYLDRTFEGHGEMMPLDFFVTYFFFLVLAVSFVNPLTRRAAFLLLNVLFLLVITITDTTPIYKFLYDHVFIFKYMRMMSFLFWTAAFPMAVLFGAWQLDIFLTRYHAKASAGLLVFVIAVHVAFGVWALSQEGVGPASWVAVAASLVFFLGVIVGRWGKKVLWVSLLVAVMAQPLALIHALGRNTPKTVKGDLISRYQGLGGKDFSFKRRVMSQETTLPIFQNGIYCGTRWYQELYDKVPAAYRTAFTANKLYLLDNTVTYDEGVRDSFYKLAQVWRDQRNVALLSEKEAGPEDVRSLGHLAATAIVVDEGNPQVKVLSFDVNTLKLRIDIDRPRFLLWSDNYHSGWHVFINGKESRLLRADHAFKGVWVPAGKSDVVFRFLTPGHYVFVYGVWLMFAGALALFLFLMRREGLCTGAGDDNAF